MSHLFLPRSNVASLQILLASPKNTIRPQNPSLDKSLTRHRVLVEIRLLHRLNRDGVPYLVLYFLNKHEQSVAMEWIEGPSIRSWLQPPHAVFEPVSTELIELLGGPTRPS